MPKDRSTPSLIRFIWDTFASVKLTVLVLLTIAASAVIGTLIPQGRPDEFYHLLFSRVRFGEELFFLAQHLDLFNMYYSLWFRALILVLALNILVCSLERLQTVWKIVFPQKRSFSAGAFSSSMAAPPIRVRASAAQLKGIYQTTFSRMFRKIHLETTEDGFCLFSEKGRWTRLGVYGVHCSVLILLAGTLIGSLCGFDGYVNIPEGETVHTIFLNKGGATRSLDFGVRCDDFTVRFYESGRPKEYRSTISLVKEGEVLVTRDVLVNKPLRYQGVNFFQSTYGHAAVKNVKIRFSSRASGMEYYRSMEMGDTVKIPEGLGTFTLSRFIETYRFKGVHDLGAALVGMLEREEKREMVALPVRFEGFDKMRGDAVVISVQDFEQQYYTGLQVTRDPGVPLVYAGFIIMIIGIYITFFTSHQRFCVRAVEADGKTTVTVLGKANKNKPAVRKKAEAISEKLALLTS